MNPLLKFLVIIIILLAGVIFFIFFGRIVFDTSGTHKTAVRQTQAPMVIIPAPPDIKKPESTKSESTKNEGMSFQLVGTIIERDPSQSIAVIRDLQLASLGRYKIADMISGYQVVRITRGRVTLLKNGKRFFLDLPSGNEPESITVLSQDTRIIHRAILAKEIPDINAALQQAIPVPFIESGKIAGIKITRLKDRSLANRAGLKEGDVATRINGERIESLQKAFDLFREFRNQEKVDIEIRRKNATKTLTYYLD